MQVTVSGRHMNVGEALKDYCQEKGQRLVRFYDRIQSIELVLDGHEGKHSVDIIVHTQGTPPFVASEEHQDAFAAVDLLMDKIERQIRRHKEKVRNRKHPPRPQAQEG